jgi:hypothetical protein
MRADIEAQLNQMPHKERNCLLRSALYPKLIEMMSDLVTADEHVLGLASSSLPADGDVEIGIFAYTSHRLIFGSMGSGWRKTIPQWRAWKWQQIQSVTPTRPVLGSVQLVINLEAGQVHLYVGQEKRDCKDWASVMCQEIASFMALARFE